MASMDHMVIQNSIKIQCEVCSEFHTRLKNMRNFSTAFIDGIAGAALKLDNVKNLAYVSVLQINFC